MIKIDFENKIIHYKCSHDDLSCGKEKDVSFEDFKNNHFKIECVPCTRVIDGVISHDSNICTHCSVGESFSINIFVNNLESHKHKDIKDISEIYRELPYINQNNKRKYNKWNFDTLEYELIEEDITDEEIKEMLEEGIKPKHRQANKEQWETNRQYHLLKRILVDGKTYDGIKDEPDIYEKVHTILKDNRKFSKVRKEHEQGIKDIRDHLKSKE